jgi:molybdopterin-guanine dinucleotide biosynthesis protein A
MLLVGSAQRNAGKTELACRVLQETVGRVLVTGLKVTTVDRMDGQCPRGGQGCGVCTSLTSPWSVTRETARDTPKDTSRLLCHGAEQVFWLRVQEPALREGARALLDQLAPGTVSICESNRLRHVVEPGLFLMVRSSRDEVAKRSAASVEHLTDITVVSDGHGFDLPLDSLSVVDGQWTVRRAATALVLAGAVDGPGARGKGPAGGDPGAATRRLVEHLRHQFHRVVVDSREPWVNTLPGVERLLRSSGPGSLGALATCMERGPDAWTLVVPVNGDGAPPGLVTAMFRRTAGVDAVVSGPPGQPLLGWYHRRVVPALADALRQGHRDVSAVHQHCNALEFRLPRELNPGPCYRGGPLPANRSA